MGDGDSLGILRPVNRPFRIGGVVVTSGQRVIDSEHATDNPPAAQQADSPRENDTDDVNHSGRVEGREGRDALKTAPGKTIPPRSRYTQPTAL